jgi:4-hydroxy-2-oxoheptanedioate aldolase
MNFPINEFKVALREQRPQIGLWSSLASNIAAEIIAGAGFDWVLIDTEHSPNELPLIQGQLQAFMESRTMPVVRPAWNDMVLLKRLLDVGVQSFLIPFVQNAEEARRAVACTRYPPQGVRGVSTSMRANRYGRIKDYHKLANEHICMLVQVETRAALSHLDEILAVDGVDGVFVGPQDLAADFGHLANPAQAEVQAAIADAFGRIRKAGKAPGIVVANEADARKWLDHGGLFVAVGSDQNILARQTEALVAKFKG